MHKLLEIDALAPASSITAQGVHRGEALPPTPACADEDSCAANDPELARINEGLQAITDDCWKRALKTTYQTMFTGNVSKMHHNPAKAQEAMWEVLGPILNENAMGYVAEKLEKLSTDEKKVCWDVLQKITAHEHNTRTYKDTTYNSQHV